ncbi:general substrate transporter [Trichoderma compactum]
MVVSHATLYNCLVTVAVAFGSLTYGYCSSSINSTIGQPGWYAYFDPPPSGTPGYATKITSTIATANGIYSASGSIGSLFIMWAASALERKPSIQIGGFFALPGGALQGGTMNIGCWHWHPEKRGWLVGHHAIFVVLGYMLSSWLGFACYFATAQRPDFAWRFPLFMQCFGPLVLLIASLWIPESPRWLLQKGKLEKAWIVVLNLRRSPEDQENMAAKEELYQIRAQITLDAARLKAIGCGPWTAVVKKKSYRKRMFIGFLTQWSAEFAGPLIINNYSVILYTNLGQTGYMPLLLFALWLTTAGLIYNPFGAWLHDKVNSRRWMFMVGLFGCLITTSGLAACVAQFAGTSNKAGNAAGMFFIFLYLAFQGYEHWLTDANGTGCDTTMYIYVAEIFPTEIRPIGMAFSLFGQFSSTVILLQTAPIGIVNVGWKYYLVIIIWCIFFIPVVYFFFPETDKLSLEEISARFGDDVAVHVTDVPDDERRALDDFLKGKHVVHLEESRDPSGGSGIKS